MTKKFKKAMTFLLGFAMLGGVIGGAALANNGENSLGLKAVAGYDWDFTTKATKHSSYTDTWTYGEVVEISGGANNNASWAYVRTGGKSSTNPKTSTMTSVKASTVDIESVNLQAVNTASGSSFTMDSINLYVASDSKFNSLIDTVSNVAVSTDMTFTPTSSTYWGVGSYFKLEFNWSSTTTSNRGMDVEKVVFNEAISSATLQSISVSDVGFAKDVYAGATWSTDGLVATGNYDDGSTKDITNSVTWNFDPATIPTTLGSTTVNVSATLDGITSNTLPITVEVVEAPAITSWDLTTASFSSQSTASVVWSSNYVTMTWNEGTSSTPANNYLGGENANSRIYNNQTFNVTAEPGYAIVQVIVTFVSSSNSNGLNGNWTTESSEIIEPIKTTDGEVLLTVDTSANPCTSISTTCTANTYISKVEVQYTTKEVVVPTVAEVAFTSGKGSYFNGGLKASNTFSTADLVVTTKDDAGNVAAQYNTGTGFVVIINGESLDATTAIQTKSFEGATAGGYPLTVTVEGLTSNEINLMVIQKDVESFNWDEPQTTTFYSHVDELALDGTLRTLFNDGSYVTSAFRYAFIVREYSETLPNNAGAEVELATHQDGTLNVAEASRYVLDIWNTDYPTSLHTYVTINVELPTLTIVDNFTGAYFTNVTRELDVTVTLTAGQTVKTLTKDEYTLSQTSVTPASTDPINVYPILVKDGQQVMTGTTPLVITPEVSTKVLNELAVDDATFSAGSYFVLPQESILLSYTDGDTSDLMFAEQENVSFKAANGDVINESTRLLRSHAGQATATYTEGASEVSCTFNLTVTNAVVAEYVEPTLGDYVKVTSVDELTDGEYLIAYTNASNDNAQVFNGIDKAYGNVSAVVNNGVIAHSAEMEAVSVQITAVEGGYSIMINSGENANKYIDSTNDDKNGMDFRTNPVALTIQSRGTITRPSSSTGSWDIYRTSEKTLSFNTASDQQRFRFFKNTTIATNDNYHAIDLYKRETTEGVGDAISYLKSVIDTYRLNNDLLSICDVDTSIYASADWTRAKEIYTSLDAAQKQQLNVQDYFGEKGKTYIDTYEMLLAKDPATQDALAPTFFGNEDTTIAVVVVIITLSAITALVGFYYYDKRRRVNK